MIARRLAFVGLCVFLTLSTLFVLARLGVIGADYDQVLNELSYHPPSSTYWMGNDIFGRNVLARAWHAGFTAVSVGAVAALVATFIGVFFGLTAGYFGGWWDDAVAWLYSVIESVPYILLLAGIAFVLGPGLVNVYLSLALTGWVALCRSLRSEVMREKNRDYVLAARAIGRGEGAIVFSHILPNVWHVIVVQFGLIFLFAVKAEVILSFLGLGVEPGRPSWGMMFDDARQELTQGVWWNFTAAAILMSLLVFSLHQSVEYARLRLDVRSMRGSSDH